MNESIAQKPKIISRNAPKRKRVHTYDDYVRLTPPHSHTQLINGNIITMASPIFMHQQVSMCLSALLYTYINANKLGQIVCAPMDVKLSGLDVFQPDILFISNERLYIIDKIVNGAPDIVIEILSPSNTKTELAYKKYMYEINDVKELWLIDIANQELSIYYNQPNDGFVVLKKYKETQPIQSTVLPGWIATPHQIFE
jgi:Uma2 family endonuclease